jgi:hypothetical protein
MCWNTRFYLTQQDSTFIFLENIFITIQEFFIAFDDGKVFIKNCWILLEYMKFILLVGSWESSGIVEGLHSLVFYQSAKDEWKKMV